MLARERDVQRGRRREAIAHDAERACAEQGDRKRCRQRREQAARGERVAFETNGDRDETELNACRQRDEAVAASAHRKRSGEQRAPPAKIARTDGSGEERERRDREHGEIRMRGRARDVDDVAMESADLGSEVREDAARHDRAQPQSERPEAGHYLGTIRK